LGDPHIADMAAANHLNVWEQVAILETVSGETWPLSCFSRRVAQRTCRRAARAMVTPLVPFGYD
jgi:hypothetical protein